MLEVLGARDLVAVEGVGDKILCQLRPFLQWREGGLATECRARTPPTTSRLQGSVAVNFEKVVAHASFDIRVRNFGAKKTVGR